MDQCVICLDDLNSENYSKIPGCGHSVHTSCLINAAQYDARCPMCRQTPENVNIRKEDNVFIMSMEEIQENYQRQVRSYNNKKYRVFNKHKELKVMYNKMKEIEKTIKQQDDNIEKLWNKKVNEMWKYDDDLQVLKKQNGLEKRKYNRINNKLKDRLENLIGEEPTFFNSLQSS